MTCLWQTIEKKQKVNLDAWIKTDIWYINHMTFSLDLKIFIRTVIMSFKGIGA
jgi:lipopolysaccharide/colanic/teichoic acid biosynthesis glycosyltransferase